MFSFQKNENKNSFYGNAQLIEELYKNYRDLMFFTANSILNDSYAAEDVVHEVFVIISAKRKEIDLSVSPRSLLVTMTKNHAIDVLRRNSSVVLTKDSDLDMITSKGDLEKTVVDKDTIRSIAEGIENLGNDYSDIFLLRYVQNLSCQQISDFLGVSLSTVNRRLKTIKKYIADNAERIKGSE